MFTIKYTRFVDIDRIVTDFPWDEFESITKEPDYKDNVLNTVEILHIWVIER